MTRQTNKDEEMWRRGHGLQKTGLPKCFRCEHLNWDKETQVKACAFDDVVRGPCGPYPLFRPCPEPRQRQHPTKLLFAGLFQQVGSEAFALGAQLWEASRAISRGLNGRIFVLSWWYNLHLVGALEESTLSVPMEQNQSSFPLCGTRAILQRRGERVQGKESPEKRKQRKEMKERKERMVYAGM